MNSRSILRTCGFVALSLVAGDAAAQSGNQSDTSGPLTTGSSIASVGVPTASGTNATPAAATTTTAAVQAAAPSVAASLSAGTMTSPATGGNISAAAQQTVLSIAQGGTPPAGLADALGGGGAGAPAAATLLTTMQGLLSNPSGGQLAAAVQQFNAIVAASGEGFLTSPPAEFQAIHATLVQLVGAATT